MIINVNSSGVRFEGSYGAVELGMRGASRNAHNYSIVRASTCVGNELQVSITAVLRLPIERRVNCARR